MTFWPLTNSDFPTNQTFHQISWPLYLAWPSPIMSGFHGAFATGVACQQGTFTIQDTCSVPIVGLACAPIVETRFLELAMSLLDLSPRIPHWYFLDFAFLHLQSPFPTLKYELLSTAPTVWRQIAAKRSDSDWWIWSWIILSVWGLILS